MDAIDLLRESDALRPLDVHAAQLLARMDATAGLTLPLAAAFASWATGQGHTCLPLSALAGLIRELGKPLPWPGEIRELRQALRLSPVIGRPGDSRPLILDDHDRLYLLRYFRCEQAVAQTLRQRAALCPEVDLDRATALLDALFPAAAQPPGSVDWQKLACALALLKPLCVIAGGPGTGKTHTVARILTLLAALAPTPPRIGLAAPTGKAALRLEDSIRRTRADLPADLAQTLPEQARTLHRLLRFQPARRRFYHDHDNPLPLDLLIVDEASMIDLSLMAAVLDALPASCRLILLGDRDQLASVEAGNLFGDLCGDGDGCWSEALRDRLRQLTGDAIPGDGSADPMTDAIVRLRVSHRFRPESGISAIAAAVAGGNEDGLARVLDTPFTDLHIKEPSQPDAAEWLRQRIEAFYTPVLAADSPQEALRALERVRILTALREGPEGVEGLNEMAETILRRRRLVAPGQHLYRGMPMMVLRNDYNLALYNGDTGVLWPDEGGVLHAWFSGENGMRAVAITRLPAWQAAFAVTVHKAQGSEFEEVLLVLPGEDLPIVSRELLYTGVTRARKYICVYGGRELLIRGLLRRTIRYSGLGDLLRRTPAQDD